MRRGPKLKGPTSDEDWQTFESALHLQCTQSECAALFRCDEDTLAKRVKERYGKKFSDVFKEKRLGGMASLRRRQWKAAMDGDTTMLIFLGKKYLGQGDWGDMLKKLSE